MRRLRHILSGLVVIAVVAAVALFFSPRPDLEPVAGYSRAVFDRDGRLMRLALAADDRYRLPVSLDAVAKPAIDATLMYEDRYFWSHPGVNPAALVRATWTTYVRRTRVMGASTITMQLARLSYRLDTRSVGGKLQQIWRALQIERHYSKRDILAAYLSRAPYGGNVEGIAAAALIYFDKAPTSLTVPEALSLAVIAQNPTARNPATSAGYAEMQRARARLLKEWSTHHTLTREETVGFELPLKVRATRDLPFRAPHFSTAVLNAAHPIEPHVATTLDLRLQSILERQLNSYVDNQASLGIDNASAVLIDHSSMDVVAAVGSRDFFDASLSGQVDGTNAKRSPGSTLKPFAYALALDHGIIHPMTLMKDAPKRFAAYTPENFDRGFMGPVTATEALILSRNVPAIDLLSKIGHQRFNKFLGTSGVRGLKPADHYGLAMVLGGNELTMMELVSLYAMLANGGIVRTPNRRLESMNRFRDSLPERVLSREASFLTLDMLRKNPRPDAIGLDRGHAATPVAWKTGTSYAHRDAWSVGVFGPYVLAVWVGNFDGSANPALVGRTAAAPLFFGLVDALESDGHNDLVANDPQPELNLRKVEMCKTTGDLAGRYCPAVERGWFIPGVSPITVSNVHRGIRVDTRTGLRACGPSNGFTRTDVYEFWPSDILELFTEAGIAIRRPPAWSKHCSLDETVAGGMPPSITSPGNNVTYFARTTAQSNQEIPLKATSDADAEWLYWFADDLFIGKARNNEALYWQPFPGHYDITAIDDLGRTNQQRIRVEHIL